MKCPKCKAISGDAWTQCEGVCPLPQSPHYSPLWCAMRKPSKSNQYYGLRKKSRRGPVYQSRPRFTCGNSGMRGLLPREIEAFYDRIESIRMQRNST